MGTRIPWGIAALLGAATVAEAGYIVAHRAAASAPPVPAASRPADGDLDRWDRRLHDAIERSGKLGDADFDALFGDDFFRRRFDPFAEIDRTSRRLEESLDAKDRPLFATAFHDWFAKRMDLAGITTKTTDTGKDVDVTFGIPGLDASSVKLDVNANRIRFRYDARAEKSSHGAEIGSVESVEKVLPLPSGADPNGFEVRKGKDEITLVFHKLASAS